MLNKIRHPERSEAKSKDLFQRYEIPRLGLIPSLGMTSAVFIIDRITKLYLPVTKYFNEGAAFGILQGQTPFLAIFSAFIIITLIIFTLKSKNPCIAQKLAISLIIGGTVGNLFDRLHYGHVIDFIDLNFIDFPVFNLADVSINIGALVLLTVLLVRK